MNRLLIMPLLALLLGAAAPERNAAVFDRAWDTVARRYWDVTKLGERWDAVRARYRPQALSAPGDRALYRVVDAMLAEVGDSHVFAIDPAERRFAEGRGREDAVGEFGLSIELEAGAWRVFAVDPGGPAAQAGVEIGWRLAAVNDRPVDQEWHPQPGESAVLSFEDNAGAIRKLTIAGAILPQPEARRAAALPGDVLHLTLDTFERGADRWMLDEIARARPRAVILDVRENYGGEAIAIARVAGVFFAKKRVLLTRESRRRTNEVPLISAGRRAWMGPVAILVGPRSASGAELVAALVRESGRGSTVGQRTAGALTGASLYDLPDGGRLSVAVFGIRTGGGTRLEGQGFQPEIEVKPSVADLRARRDPVLAAAVARLTAPGA